MMKIAEQLSSFNYFLLNQPPISRPNCLLNLDENLAHS